MFPMIKFLQFLFYSILLYTFMARNLCQTDSKAQHQNPISKIIYPIAIAKSTSMETLDRVYAMLGMPL